MHWVPRGETQLPRLAPCLMGFHSNINSRVICIASALSSRHLHQWLQLTSEQLHTYSRVPGKYFTHSWRCAQYSSGTSFCFRCSFLRTRCLLWQRPSEKYWRYPGWLGKHIHMVQPVFICARPQRKVTSAGLKCLSWHWFGESKSLNKNQLIYSMIFKAKN